MHTQCNSADLTLEGLGQREVIGKFDGGGCRAMAARSCFARRTECWI